MKARTAPTYLRYILALLVGTIILLGTGPRAGAAEPIEIFDAHLHYNWEPKPYFPVADVLALFRKHRVTGILATSRPNTGTHALVAEAAAGKANGLWIVPFIRPYRIRADIGSWFNDPSIQDLVREEYKRGGYRGIGEFHLTGRAAATDWVRKTVDFAVAHDLYLHAHADAEAVEILFTHNTKSRIIWAHTGFSLAPDRVAALLDKYPALWGELSYRGGIAEGTTSQSSVAGACVMALAEAHCAALRASAPMRRPLCSCRSMASSLFRAYSAKLPAAMAARASAISAR